MLLNAKSVNEAEFATSMSGYKKDEVNALLDKVISDYQQFESVLAAQQNRIAVLEKELSEKEASTNSINTVLISAQKLADEIVSKAKVDAEEIVAAANEEAENIKFRTKKALEEIDSVLTEQKNNAQAQVDIMLEEAARKSEGMILAAKDSVTREQLLFDKLKSEVAEFKAEIKEAYKIHLESLSKLPEEVVFGPELAAKTIEDIINKEPDLLKFIEKTPVEVFEEVEVDAEEDALKTQVIELPSDIEEEVPASNGFVVDAIEDDEDMSDNESDGPAFTKGFFAKNK
ncbi:MAG: DivIVA domain-containing protein [Clostridia bacterium]|nr:DivIVA domain-containing protein [Clostridia bacterium]